MITKFIDDQPEIYANLQGGLSRLAEVLEVQRIGQTHQAGSDSLVTGGSFFKLIEMILKPKNLKYELEFNNVLFGFGESKNEEGYIEQYKEMTKKLMEDDVQNEHMDESHMPYYYHTDHMQSDEYGNPYIGMDPQMQEYYSYSQV